MAIRYFDKTHWWMYFGSKKATYDTETVMAVLNARDVQRWCAGESGKRRGSKEEQFPAAEEVQSYWKTGQYRKGKEASPVTYFPSSLCIMSPEIKWGKEGNSIYKKQKQKVHQFWVGVPHEWSQVNKVRGQRIRCTKISFNKNNCYVTKILNWELVSYQETGIMHHGRANKLWDLANVISFLSSKISLGA